MGLEGYEEWYNWVTNSLQAEIEHRITVLDPLVGQIAGLSNAVQEIANSVQNLSNEFTNSIQNLSNSLTTLSTQVSNGFENLSEAISDEAEARSNADKQIINWIDSIVNPTIPDADDGLNGKRKLFKDFYQFLTTKDVKGLDEKLSLLEGKIDNNLDDIFADIATGITIDKSNPIRPRITKNEPNWNSIQNKPSLINSIKPGKNIDIDTSNPKNPIIHAENQQWNDIQNKPKLLKSIQKGTGINVDFSDPENPIISSTGGAGGAGDLLTVPTQFGSNLDINKFPYNLPDGRLILLTGQNDKTENGVYIKQGIILTRSPLLDTFEKIRNTIIYNRSTNKFYKVDYNTFENVTGTIGTDNIEYIVANLYSQVRSQGIIFTPVQDSTFHDVILPFQLKPGNVVFNVFKHTTNRTISAEIEYNNLAGGNTRLRVLFNQPQTGTEQFRIQYVGLVNENS